MNFKKSIGILVVFLIVISSIGIVSASEVNIDDVKFNIPDGFKENTAESEVIKDSSGTTTIKCYENDEKEGILIQVISMSEGRIEEVDPEPGDVNKTINGIEGFYNNDTTEFKFTADGKLIFVSAHDESLLNQILIKQ